MKNPKNIFLALCTGLLMLVAGYGVSIVAGSISPALTTEYSNEQIFRPWSDLLMKLYWIIPFISAIILFWLWNFIKPLIKGTTFFQRGLSFGFIYWMATLPGMLMSYSSFQLSFGLVFSWTVSGLVEAIVAGVIYARLRP